MRAVTAGCPCGGALQWTWEAAVKCGTGWFVAFAPQPQSPTQRRAPGVGRASPSAPPRQTWDRPRSPSTTCWPESLISYRYCGNLPVKGTKHSQLWPKNGSKLSMRVDLTLYSTLCYSGLLVKVYTEPASHEKFLWMMNHFLNPQRRRLLCAVLFHKLYIGKYTVTFII